MSGRLSMRLVWKQLFSGLVNAVFPAKCLACGRLFPKPDRVLGAGEAWENRGAALADHFCPPCCGQWTPVDSPLCSRCGMVFTSRTGADHWCGRCLAHPGAYTRARAIGIYDGSLREAIHALKFNGQTRLAVSLGLLLWAAYQRYWRVGEIDVIAPVPLHSRRLRRRGFNQAYQLIQAWELPVETIVVRDLLVRRRDTAPQSGLDRRQRQMNIKHAFAVNRSGASAGKQVLLVDDVLTTGATAEACANVLLQDGARRVDVLTVARA